MTGDNQKYGRLISDANYIENVIGEMQMVVDFQRNEDVQRYSEDVMKAVVLEKLDEREIYPDDVDYIFSQLDF